MAKTHFVLVGQNDGPSTKYKVNDGDGDFNVNANGVDLGYISASDGKLHLFEIHPEDRSRLEGLTFDADGRIEIYS
jgi:hypothetical protein